jgi:predicted DNA-binding transcriptional regulator YafY
MMMTEEQKQAIEHAQKVLRAAKLYGHAASIADTAGAKYTQADMERYGKCYADARDKRRADTAGSRGKAIDKACRWKGEHWPNDNPEWTQDAATPAPSVADAPRRFTGEQIAALRVAADALIERYAEPIRAILRDAEVADAAGASERERFEAWAIKQGYAFRVYDDFTARPAYNTGLMWAAWKAAIAKESGND